MRISRLTRFTAIGLVLVLGISTQANAQTGSIRIKVIDHRNEPVMFAAVYIVSDSTGTSPRLPGEMERGSQTDVYGMSTFGDLAPGIYWLYVKALGYHSEVERVTVEAGSEIRAEIQIFEALVGYNTTVQRLIFADSISAFIEPYGAWDTNYLNWSKSLLRSAPVLGADGSPLAFFLQPGHVIRIRNDSTSALFSASMKLLEHEVAPVVRVVAEYGADIGSLQMDEVLVAVRVYRLEISKRSSLGAISALWRDIQSLLDSVAVIGADPIDDMTETMWLPDSNAFVYADMTRGGFWPHRLPLPEHWSMSEKQAWMNTLHFELNNLPLWAMWKRRDVDDAVVCGEYNVDSAQANEAIAAMCDKGVHFQEIVMRDEGVHIRYWIRGNTAKLKSVFEKKLWPGEPVPSFSIIE